MKAIAYMMSCPEREKIRNQTLLNLQVTDWDDPVRVEVDQAASGRKQERQERTALRLLQRAVSDASELIIFLEDDLQFNQHLRHNLEHWYPLKELCPEAYFFGSLYNPNIRELARHEELDFFIADPSYIYGSQAFILSLATAQFIVTHWEEVHGMQDIKMSRLASRICPIYYHIPSLVQHTGITSLWGGGYHYATDFKGEWRASSFPYECITIPRGAMRLLILDRMRTIEGWLEDAEAELLIDLTEQALNLTPERQGTSIVEVGSYCGKSTVVLGLAVKESGRSARVYAIDPHEGAISTLDQSIFYGTPTLERFRQNINEAGLADVVELIQNRSTDVLWSKPIELLFIDGLHDYDNVAADFHHFANWIRPGGVVAFHDCGYHFPGVKKFVDELASSNQYQQLIQVKNLIALQKKW